HNTNPERNPTSMRRDLGASPSTYQSRNTNPERNPTSMRRDLGASPSTYPSHNTNPERNPTSMRREVTPNPYGKISGGDNWNRGGKGFGIGDTSVAAVGLSSLAVLAVTAAVAMTPL
ncbi:hypothetical protein TraAM80_09970, partial [Trypanosoma rangeli]